MKDFFKTSSFKVLAIAVVVLLGLIIYTATAGGSLLASLLGFVTSPMQSVSNQATGAVTVSYTHLNMLLCAFFPKFH